MIFLAGPALLLTDAAITLLAGRYLDVRDVWRRTGVGRARVVGLGSFHAFLGAATVLLLIDLGWAGTVWSTAGVALGEWASTLKREQ